MRFIYVNHRCVNIGVDCGFFPITKCPVQVWAAKNNMPCRKIAHGLFDREIRLQAEPAQEQTIAKQIQEICDNCKYDYIKQKTR